MRFSFAESMCDPGHYLPLAIAADQSGWTSFVVPDSICYPAVSDSRYPYTPDGNRSFLEDQPFLEPFSLIPALGAVTERLRFPTFVVKLPVRHPVLVAKSASSVAVLTGNRFAFGVGLSPWPEDYRVCGQEWKARGRRMDEMIEIVRGLTAGGGTRRPAQRGARPKAAQRAARPKAAQRAKGERRRAEGERRRAEGEGRRAPARRAEPGSYEAGGYYEFHGDHYDLERIKICPVPSQSIPILIGGHSEPALRRAARLGDGWMHAGGDQQVLEKLMRRLAELRAEYGREREPFEVHVISLLAYSIDGIRRLEDLGVTDVIVGFRNVYEKDTMALDQKRAALRRYAGEVIAKL